MTTPASQILPIDESACYALLAEATVGRVAVTIGAVPAVLPVTFCLVEGQIVFRTGSGGPLLDATDGRVVAFEVDNLPTGAEPAGAAAGWWVQVVGWAKRVGDAEELRAKACAAVPWGWQHDGTDVVVAVEPRVVSGRRLVRAEPD